MLRTTRKVLLVPMLAAALLGAGCSSTVPGSAAPTGGTPGASDAGGTGGGVGATDDPVAWMDRVCGGLTVLTEAPAEPPQLDPSGSPAQAFEQFRAQLAKTGEDVDRAIDGVRAAGPSPIEGGDALVQQMTEALGAVKTSFDTAQDRLADIDPNDPDSLAQGLGALTPPEGIEELANPQELLRENPALVEAAEQAPKCQELGFTR